MTSERTGTAATMVAATALLVAVLALIAATNALFRTRALTPEPTSRPASEGATVTAPAFELRDADGKLRGRLSDQGLSLADGNGRLRAAMALSEAGVPSFTFFGKDGRVRTVLALGSEDTPALTLHDAQGRVRARIVVGTDGAARVETLDERGTPDVATAPAPASAPSPTRALSSRRDRSR